MDPINSAGPIKQTAVLLFYGWGYNFYRRENQLRADDLLIRTKVGGILAQARSHLSALEAVDPQLAQAYRVNAMRTAQRVHAPQDVLEVLAR